MSTTPPIKIEDLHVESLGHVGLNRTFSVRGDGFNPRLTLVGNRDGQINVYLTQHGSDRVHIGQYYYPDRPAMGLSSIRDWVMETRIKAEIKVVLHLDPAELDRAMAAFVLAERKLRKDLLRKTIPWTRSILFQRQRRQRVERE